MHCFLQRVFWRFPSRQSTGSATARKTAVFLARTAAAYNQRNRPAGAPIAPGRSTGSVHAGFRPFMPRHRWDADTDLSFLSTTRSVSCRIHSRHDRNSSDREICQMVFQSPRQPCKGPHRCPDQAALAGQPRRRPSRRQKRIRTSHRPWARISRVLHPPRAGDRHSPRRRRQTNPGPRHPGRPATGP